MAVNITTFCNSLNEEFIDVSRYEHLLLTNLGTHEFLKQMLQLITKDNVDVISFNLQYTLCLNGPPVNLSLNKNKNLIFDRYFFDAFGQISYQTYDDAYDNYKLSQVIESNGIITTQQCNLDLTEILPVCSCPYTKFSLMITDSSKKKKIPAVNVPIVVKAYIFIKKWRDELIRTPLLLPERKFHIADGLVYRD